MITIMMNILNLWYGHEDTNIQCMMEEGVHTMKYWGSTHRAFKALTITQMLYQRLTTVVALPMLFRLCPRMVNIQIWLYCEWFSKKLFPFYKTSLSSPISVIQQHIPLIRGITYILNTILTLFLIYVVIIVMSKMVLLTKNINVSIWTQWYTQKFSHQI